MERKDVLLLFTAIVGVGLFLRERGELMDGVPYDPVTGTVLIYVGYALIMAGGAFWLFVATRPLWRRRIPWKYKLLRYGTKYEGDQALFAYRTWIKIALCGHPLPEILFVECDAPIHDAEWEAESIQGVSREGWIELIPQSPKTAYMRLRWYGQQSESPALVSLTVLVMAHDPIEILYIRQRRLPQRLSTP